MCRLKHCLTMAFAAVLTVPVAAAAERSPGRDLVDVMGFVQNYEEGEVLCRELAAQMDVEAAAARSPDLLGGIKPTDSEWAEARALYIDQMKAACDQDIPAYTEAFVQALDATLTPTDLEALTDFYRSDLGRKFRDASLKANLATYRVMIQEAAAGTDYTAFGEAIAALIAKRTPTVAPEPAPKPVQTLVDATAALALSDRVMQAVVQGRAREAMDMLKPHTIAPDAQFDAMSEQIEKQQATIDARFGESLDYELLRNDAIGDSMNRAVFLHRFERSAMIWLFTWYRGKEGWVLTNVRFADDASLLFR